MKLSGLRTPKPRFLLLAVAICSCGLLLAVMLLLQTALQDIAAKSDQLEDARTQELVASAMQGLVNRVGAMTTDNSAWDAAVTSVYGPKLDTRWADENWGPGAEDAKPYDGIFLLDETGAVLWGTFRGERVEEASSAFLGAGLRALFEKQQTQIDKGRTSYSGLTVTESGPAVISAALIRPAKAPFAQLGKTKRYVVLTRHLTPEIIASVGESLKLRNFHLSADGASRVSHLPLRDLSGKAFGNLTWSPRLSGAEAAGAGKAETRQTIILVGSLVMLMMFVVGYALHKFAESEAKARQNALTDALSQLPNRRALHERLQMYTLRTEKSEAAVVFIDLDGFKTINDTYGHDIGDNLICEIASLLSYRLPAGATLARIGGDEFAMFAHGSASRAVAQRFALDTLDALSRPVVLGERLLRPGASVGVAVADLCHTSADELLRRADIAMYHAKETGRGRVVEYTAQLEEERIGQRDLEEGIRQGLARNEFNVVYQPVVDAQGHEVTGVEALVRWPGRAAGPFAPDAFIPAAEKSGLIRALGLFVLERACRDLVDRPQLQLSVNVSPVQFRDADFEFRVLDILEKTGFPPQRLELEITESHLVDNPSRAVDVIRSLRAIGVKFSLDDFGTGYSSIGYLRQFQFDRIKIDRSLASVVDTDVQAGALVAGTVHIAKALSMTVTAEGVETDELAKMLKLAGCTSLQGYYFGRPGPFLDVERLVARRA